jgi:AcrR family transcriptional regulator
VVSSRPRRLGRPIASDGDERRRLIVESARRQFALSGYAGTTNREIAEQAGITTGAIYHYFRSKLDVYLAVFEETDRVILERYGQVTSDPTMSFDEMVAAILEVSSQMNREDESLAAFITSASVDAHRTSDLMASYKGHDRQMAGFFEQLVDRGIEEGSLDPALRSDAMEAIRVLTIGLTWYSVRVHDPEAHRKATLATVAALRGQLFAPVRPRRRRQAG